MRQGCLRVICLCGICLLDAIGGVEPVDWSFILPEAEGKALTVAYCSMCHSLQNVAVKRGNGQDWTMTVDKMISYQGAPIKEEEAATISRYLSDVFGQNIPPFPFEVNKVEENVLAKWLRLDKEEIANFTKYRNSRSIRDLEELALVLGKPITELKKYEALLSFGTAREIKP